MKYSDMRKQLDSGRFEKRPRNTTKPAHKPVYRPETELAQAPDLLTALDAESWLANRLKNHGCDIYAHDPQAPWLDQLGACIVANGMQCVIMGRNRETNKPESYAQCYQRLAGKPLPKKSDVPRGTSNTQHQTSETTP